jgi:predicted HAD superfamily Cof-like phosphohydrolase
VTLEQSKVLEFHRVFGATVNSKPTMPSLADKQLRVKLIAEELNEFSEALEAGDLVKIADALGDTLYVVLGSAVTCGIDLETVLSEIHRSNMTKLWTYNELDKVPSTDCPVIAVRNLNPNDRNTRAFVVKRADGKVLKSPSYEPANISAIIERQAA